MTEDEVIDRVLDGVKAGRGGWICPVNLDVLRKITRDPALSERSSRGRSGRRRRHAPGVGEPTPGHAAARARRGLLAGHDAAGRRRRRRARRSSCWAATRASPSLRPSDCCGDHAGSSLAGTHCPPLGFERSTRRTRDDRRSARRGPARTSSSSRSASRSRTASILRLRSRVARRPGSCRCGISLSFVSGDVQRAPVWAQRLGLEWVHRLVQEPRRLARRYLVEGIPFFALA